MLFPRALYWLSVVIQVVIVVGLFVLIAACHTHFHVHMASKAGSPTQDMMAESFERALNNDVVPN